MKNLFYIMLLLPVIAIGQTDTINYVKTLTYNDFTQTTNENKANVTITYYDGLGRPIQQITGKGTPDKKDIITHIEYDAFGRQARQYMPYPSDAGTLLYRPEANTGTTAYYTSTYGSANNNPYTQQFFEPSPLNRVLKQGAPGESWKGNPNVYNETDHTVKFNYQTNKGREVMRFKVKFADPNDTEKPTLTVLGYFSPNQLLKTITKNENWIASDGKSNTTEEFTDKNGRMVLKRNFAKNQAGQDDPHDTYYVYDDYGNLTYVIPPLAAYQIVMEEGYIWTIGTINYPWVKLVKASQATLEDYMLAIQGYSNAEILNLPLASQYGGQGGFGLSTDEAGNITLNINTNTLSPMEYRTGIIASLDDLGSFDDKEIGRIQGSGYEYTFFIRNNSVVVDGQGFVPSLIKTLYSNQQLDYAKNYPWIDVCDADAKVASRYRADIQALDNADILTTYTPNDYGGAGGLSVSIASDDNVTLSISISSEVDLSFLNGAAFTIDSQRAIQDMTLGSVSGNGYSYEFSIKSNQLMISGSGKFKNFNTLLSSRPILSYSIKEEAKRLCYIYHYDTFNRVIEKHIPDNGWTHIIYDKRHRPIMTQDENMRQNISPEHNWLFNKYDNLNRSVMTGSFRAEGTRAALQEWHDDNQPLVNEMRVSTPIINRGMKIYYANSGFGGDGPYVHTANYYDDYNFDTELDAIGINGMTGGNYYITFTTKNKGLATGNQVRVLGTNDYITNVMSYDEKARPVWNWNYNSYFNSPTNKSWNLVHTKLDFTGKVLETLTQHKNGDPATPGMSIFDYNTYDHIGRLLRHSQKIENQDIQLISWNKYDVLGQLVQKKVGGKKSLLWPSFNDYNAYQTIDYTYNIRGWLKSINDPNILDNDLFGFGIKYEDFGGYSKFNGNIAQTYWKTASDNILKRYDYEYDALDRLSNAGFYENGLGVRYNEGDITYDKNGNIQKMYRSGLKMDNSLGGIDNLSYIYKPYSNQLLKVTDAISEAVGFKDGINSGNDYDYDAAGNMRQDLNKGIGTVLADWISYNHLNLPIAIIKDTDHKIEYIYDATGTKLQKKVTDGTGIGSVKTTQYINGFVYKDNALEYFPNPEGYARKETNENFSYVYQYKDHLGNVRLSYADANSDGTITGTSEIIEVADYYPFGMQHDRVGKIVTSTNLGQKIKYNGKELQDELGLGFYDYGARNYDPAIGRWFNIDPKAEQGRRWSPYAYAFDNPVYFIDPDGMWPWPTWNDVKSTFSQVKQTVSKTYNETKKTVAAAANTAIKTTKEVAAKAQKVIKDNKESILSVAKTIQTTGDYVQTTGLAAAGVGSFVEGVGAIPGLKVAEAGTYIGWLGDGIEIATNAITGDEATAAGQTATIVASEVTAKLVDKAVPGPNPDVSPMVKDLITTTREVTKNTVTNTAKKINED